MLQNKPGIDKNADPTVATTTFQMRPSLSETFKSGAVKEVIQKVLNETLTGKTYNAAESANWTKLISNEVSTGVRELNLHHFKHVVQVTLGQQTGAGCQYITRCRWDADCDGFTSEQFTNASLFCIVTVFGIYMY